jgi:uncharacterized membrane protein YczE
VLCGIGVALLVRSGQGLGPWDVLHEGLAVRTGIPMGRVTIAVGVVVLLAWVPLRQRPGVGTISNVLVIGLTVDAALGLVGAPASAATRGLFAILAVPLVGVGSGLYLGVDLGPGPRDGVMTGLAARGIPIAVARTGLELGALGTGWLFGGTVGLGTVWFALGIGPTVAWTLPRLRAPWHRDGPAVGWPRQRSAGGPSVVGPAPS